MKVLVAIDGSDHSKHALNLIKKIPLPSDSSLTLMSVFEPLQFDWVMIPDQDFERMTQYNNDARTKAEALLKEFSSLVPQHFECKTEVREGIPGDMIVKAANEENFDLVLMGSRGLNPVKRFLIGSVSEKVLKKAKCSVLISKAAGEITRPLDVIASYDGGDASKKMLDTLENMDCSQFGHFRVVAASELRYHYGMADAIRLSEAWKLYRQATNEMLNGLKSAKHPKISEKVETVHLDAVGDAADAIMNYAEETNTDLIVAGFTGKSALEQLYVGSFTLKIARHAASSILVIR